MNFKKFLTYSIAIFILVPGLAFSMEKQESNEKTVITHSDSGTEAQVAQILKDNWSSLYVGKEYDPVFAKDHLITPVETPTGSRYVKVIRNNDETYGFITYYCIPENPENKVNEPRRGYIELLAVDTNHRRKGYARQMMTHTIEELKKFNPVKIEIFASKTNDVTIGLYKKLGFEQVQEGKNMIKLELKLI